MEPPRVSLVRSEEFDDIDVQVVADDSYRVRHPLTPPDLDSEEVVERELPVRVWPQRARPGRDRQDAP